MKFTELERYLIVLVRAWAIGRSVSLCTDCLSANQIKELVLYFNQYTINCNTFHLQDTSFTIAPSSVFL